MWENDPVLNYVVRFLQQNHISVHMFTPPLADADTMIDGGLRASILQPDANTFWSHFIAALDSQKLYFVTDEFQCSYTALCLPESDQILLCGPVTFEHIHGERLMEIINRLKMPPPQLYDMLQNEYMHIPFVSMQSFYLGLFTQLSSYLFGAEGYEIVHTNPGEFSTLADYYENYFRIPDKPFTNIQVVETRYRWESELIEAVTSGNEAKALELLGRSAMYFLPERLSSELRDLKDYTITLNVLLRKAVERGGVHPIHIDNLSNQNIKNIENLTSVEKCHRLWREIIHSYCGLVHEYTFKEYSPLIQKALTCISTDLTADLSLKSLANHLSVNASYLSTLFKKEMGISLTDYVNKSRITRAQRLLLETDLPIKTIAGRCGIADIYYFGRLFKNITGTTPTAFRREG